MGSEWDQLSVEQYKTLSRPLKEKDANKQYSPLTQFGFPPHEKMDCRFPREPTKQQRLEETNNG